MLNLPQTATSMFSRLAGQSAQGAKGFRHSGSGGRITFAASAGGMARSAGGSGAALIESLEARQIMAADLAIELGNYAPLAFYVPGETVTIPYVVRNNESSPFTGRAVVSLSLNGTKIVIPTSSLSLTNLAQDATATGTVSFTVPNGFDPGYFTPVLALTLRNAAGTQNVTDNSTLDNELTLTNNELRVSWGFGNFAGRTGVVMRAVDGDGTQFTMSMSGGGHGEFSGSSYGSLPDRLTLTGIRGASGPIAQTINFALVAGSPGSVEGADFRFAVEVESPDPSLPLTLIGALNAPAINFNSGFSLQGFVHSVTNASTTVTVRDIGSPAYPSGAAFITGDVGSFTAAAVRGRLEITGRAGAIRLGSLSDGVDGSDGVLSVVGGAVSLTIGSPTNLSATAVQNARIIINGDVGAVSIGKMNGTGTNASITLYGRVGPVTIGDVVSGNISLSNAPTSFTIRDVRNSAIFMGQVGNLGTVATPFTAREIVRSNITLLYPVSTFTASKWYSGTSLGLSELGNVLRANSIATMTIGVAGASTDASNGNFDATAYIGSQLSRPTQLGTVNIYGTLEGSFFVSGSVGAFTAKVVRSEMFRFPESFSRGPGLVDWAPALTATGSVLSFTSGDVRSGAVWVNSLRTLNVTITSDNRNFELVAGFRADRNAIIDGAGRTVVLYGSLDYNAPQIRSGIIGALNLTLRTPTGGAVTGFTGRFAAGLDVLRTDYNLRRFAAGGIGALNFANLVWDNTVGTPASDGKINAINVTGVLAGNSLGFAARDFPVARFNFGTLQTGGAGVLIPARTHPYSSGISGTSIPANTFFRVGLPD